MSLWQLTFLTHLVVARIFLAPLRMHSTDAAHFTYVSLPWSVCAGHSVQGTPPTPVNHAKRLNRSRCRLAWRDCVGSSVCTSVPHDKCDWLIGARRRCCLMSNYCDHLLRKPACFAADEEGMGFSRKMGFDCFIRLRNVEQIGYWHCWHSMHSRVYATVGRPSVSPSVCSYVRLQ